MNLPGIWAPAVSKQPVSSAASAAWHCRCLKQQWQPWLPFPGVTGCSLLLSWGRGKHLEPGKPLQSRPQVALLALLRLEPNLSLLFFSLMVTCFWTRLHWMTLLIVKQYLVYCILHIRSFLASLWTATHSLLLMYGFQALNGQIIHVESSWAGTPQLNLNLCAVS